MDLGWRSCFNLDPLFVGTYKYVTSLRYYINPNKGGLIDYSTFVPDPIAKSSEEAEYNASAVACMATLHNRFK